MGYSAKGLNCTEDRSCGFCAKTSSNGVKPCNVLDAKVFMAYAATDAYNGHMVPFPMRCLVIMFPIVWICHSALELPWFHGLIICIEQFIDCNRVLITCPVKALSLSTDKNCGGPEIVKTW